MTEATLPNVDDLSQRIAARGRVALVERLRTAYKDAASAHGDIVSLGEDRLEALVQNAADHADGLQWRRALAGLAAEELGVTIAEALSHPAVVRAQSLVGAPSYEQSLAELITRPIPPPLPSKQRDYDDPERPPAQIDGQLQLSAEDEREAAAAAAAAAAEAGSGEPEPEAHFEHAQAELPVTDESHAEGLEETIADDSHAEGFEETITDDSHADGLEETIADDAIVELLPEPDPSFEVDTESYDLSAEHAHGEAGDNVWTTPEAEMHSEPEVEVQSEPEAGDVQTEPEADAPTAPADRVAAALGLAYGTAPGDAATGDAAGAEALEQRTGGEFVGRAPAGPEVAADSPSVGDGVGELTVTAVHLGGVANLPTGGDGLGLRMSELGLDIMRSGDDIIGRLPWSEIEALEVPSPRRRRRNHNVAARLVVRTRQGDASFEIPGYSSEELRDRVELRLDRYRQL
jgi:hypothetical protein